MTWPILQQTSSIGSMDPLVILCFIIFLFHLQVPGGGPCCHCRNQNVQREGQLDTELRRFCENSSVKGVKRTVGQGRAWIRAIWIIAVLGCLTLSIGHACLLLLSYIKYPSVVYMDEDVIKIRPDPDQNSVPAITVCNTQPLSKRRNQHQDIVTFLEFVDSVEAAFQKFNNSNVSFPVRWEESKNEILSLIGYYQYLGAENATKVGHSFEDFVVVCDVMVIEATQTYLKPCTGLANISLDSNSNYFNCYTINPADQTNIPIVIGYSLVLYVGADMSWTTSPYSGGDPLKYSKGAVYALHQPNAKPSMDLKGMSLAAGELTISKVNLQKRQRLGEPYDGCVDPHLQKFKLQDGSPMRYTGFTCWNGCVESKVIQECQCRDGFLPGVIWHEAKGLPFCGDGHAPIDVLIERITCANKMRKAVQIPCYHSCELPCREALYVPLISHFDWPDISDLGQFYNTYVEGAPVQDLFGTIEEVTGGNCHTLNASCAHNDSVIKEIKSNFLSVRAHLFDQRFMTVGFSPSITLTNFISQLGGALNLWSGISVVVIVEVLEVLLRLIIPSVRTLGTQQQGRSPLVPPQQLWSTRENIYWYDESGTVGDVSMVYIYVTLYCCIT